MLINEKKLKDLLKAKLNNDSSAEKEIKESIYEFIYTKCIVSTIIYDYIELALENYKINKQRVDITQTEMEAIQKSFNSCFRIKGFKADGTIETRGRKRNNN